MGHLFLHTQRKELAIMTNHININIIVMNRIGLGSHMLIDLVTLNTELLLNINAKHIGVQAIDKKNISS